MVLLVIFITARLVQPLAIRVILRLHANADAVASRLLASRVGRCSRSRRSRLKHGWIFDKRLWYPIPRVVRRAIVLVLRVMVSVVVGDVWGRITLLGRLSPPRLGLTSLR